MPKSKVEWVAKPTEEASVAFDVPAPVPPAQVAETPTASPTQDVVGAMVEALLRQSKALETQVERTAPKENPNYQVNSLFIKPTGETYASDLKCDVYIGPALLNRTPLTQEEVRQANRLRPIARVKVVKMDRSVVTGSVSGTLNASDQLERLTVHLPMAKDDNPQMYPPLDELLRQIADQAEQEAVA